MPGQVADDLPAAHGVTDEDRIVQVEGIDDLPQIIREGVQVMARCGRAGSTVAAAVKADTAETVFAQESLLVTPHGGGQGQAVNEHDGPAGSPVAVKQLDAVARLDFHR